MKRSRQNIILGAVMVLGFAAIFGLSNALESGRPALPDDYEDSDLAMNGSRLKGFALGMEGLIADWYWMRSLQYVGNKVEKSKAETINIDNLRDLNPRLLYPLLNNATDLDPHFITAYSYGSIVLPAIDPAKAIAIAEKGIANNPQEWRLYQQLGYIHWKLKEYDKAAEAYEKGSEIGGSAAFMKMMAGVIKNDGGSRSTSRKIFQQMYDGSDDPMVRLTAIRRLNEFDSLDEREAINKILADHQQNTGRCVNTLSEILPMLRSVRLPEGHDFRLDNKNQLVDPTDAPYLLDRQNCRATLDGERTGVVTTK